MAAYRNRFGREWGRGWRPWLLIPKVLAVVAFGGGLLSASVLLHLRPDDAAGLAARLDALRVVFRGVIIPGSTAAVALGIALLLPHATILLRTRWLRAKLVLALLGLPAAHFTVFWSLHQARASLVTDPAAAESYMTCAALAVDATLVLLVLLVILGRQKPRLGERYGTRRRQGQDAA